MKRIILFDKVPFDPIIKKQLLTKIIELILVKKKCMVLNMNAFGVVTFLKNNKYARIIKSAEIIYSDGWGPVLASRLTKESLPERVNVGDFIDNLLEKLDNRGFRLFLLGCEKKTVMRTQVEIMKKYQRITICGHHHGFFRKKQESDVVDQIRKAFPDIVLVGMGVPIQEYFIANNWDLLPNAVYMGIGGVFYYIAGLKTRAPNWMRDYSLEWLFRLFQEPERLWKRYTVINLLFISFIIKYFLNDLFSSPLKSKNN